MLLILLTGCSILRKEQKQSIVGTWTGKAIVAYQGTQKKYDISLILSDDMTMTLSYDIGGKKLILNGNYTTDLSKNPALIDIINFGFPKGTAYCCMAIAEFPIVNKMIISGLIGQCGQVSRPAEFDRNPSDRHQIYFELTKKE